MNHKPGLAPGFLHAIELAGLLVPEGPREWNFYKKFAFMLLFCPSVFYNVDAGDMRPRGRILI